MISALQGFEFHRVSSDGTPPLSQKTKDREARRIDKGAGRKAITYRETV